MLAAQQVNRGGSEWEAKQCCTVRKYPILTLSTIIWQSKGLREWCSGVRDAVCGDYSYSTLLAQNAQYTCRESCRM